MEQIASDTMKEIPVPVAIDDKQKQDEAWKPEHEEDKRPDENFLCKLLQTGDDSVDLSLNCEHLSGDQEKSVMLLIPRDIIGDRKDRLFNKNVKIVVKDFMLMDRSPRRL